MKINCVVNRLPEFACCPSPADGAPGPMHVGTIHFTTAMEEIEAAYLEAAAGKPATRSALLLPLNYKEVAHGRGFERPSLSMIESPCLYVGLML